MALVLVALIVFPLVAGNYIGQVMMLVGLYILMGMGLNLEVGLAGLLDLGFVAFFAVGRLHHRDPDRRQFARAGRRIP